MAKITLRSTNKEDLTTKVIEFEHPMETDEDHQKLLDMVKSDTEYRDLYINLEFTDGILPQLYATNNPDYKLEDSIVWRADHWTFKLYTDKEDKLYGELYLPGLVVHDCSESIKNLEAMLLEVYPFIKGRYKKIYWKVCDTFYSEYKDDNKE